MATPMHTDFLAAPTQLTVGNLAALNPNIAAFGATPSVVSAPAAASLATAHYHQDLQATAGAPGLTPAQMVQAALPLLSQPQLQPRPPGEVNSTYLYDNARVWWRIMHFARDLAVERSFRRLHGGWEIRLSDHFNDALLALHEVYATHTSTTAGLAIGIPEDYFGPSSPELVFLVAKGVASAREKIKIGGKFFIEDQDRFSLYHHLANGSPPTAQDFNQRIAILDDQARFFHTTSYHVPAGLVVEEYTNRIIYDIIYKAFYHGEAAPGSPSHSIAKGILSYYNTYNIAPNGELAFVNYIPLEAVALAGAAVRHRFDVLRSPVNRPRFHHVVYRPHYLTFGNNIVARGNADLQWRTRWFNFLSQSAEVMMADEWV